MLFMERFQLGAVFGRVDADALYGGGIRQHVVMGGRRIGVKTLPFLLRWVELVFGPRRSPCVGTGCRSFGPRSEKGC